MTDRATKIRALNDAFRTSMSGGRVLITAGVNARGPAFVAEALAAIRTFDAWSTDIDPHGEHDMVRVTIDGAIVWAKLDYYDAAMRFGSEDPSDPEKTTRVLTVLFPEEY